MKILKLLPIIITSIMTAVQPAVISAKASDNFQIGGDGVEIIYNSEKDGGDYGWIAYDKYNTFISQQISYINQVKKYVVIGFDAPQMSEIERMGFYVTYKEPNFFDEIGNWWESIWNNPPKHGTTKTDSVLVKASTKYTFEHRRNGMESVFDFTPGHDALDYEFSAIGKVSDLIETEQRFKSDFNNSPNTSNIKTFNVTGGFFWNFNHNDSLNDSTKSFTSRKYYAIIPFDWTEEIQPESIKAYDIFGQLMDDGLDENGNPYLEHPTLPGQQPSYYIDLIVSKDVGISVNGINAKVTKIQVTGYTPENGTAVLIENADFDYNTQQTTNIRNKQLILEDGVIPLNWEITNNNRYLFVKYMAENIEDAQQIKIRIFYTNENQKASWIIRIKGDLGFLPPPYVTEPTMRPINDWDKLVRIVMFGLIGILAFAVIYMVFGFIGKVRQAVRWN